MNAPIEVFISFPDQNDQHSWAVRTNIGEVRYLRANLTCIECYHIMQDTEDALLWHCDNFGEPRNPTRPACMDFKEKE